MVRRLLLIICLLSLLLAGSADAGLFSGRDGYFSGHRSPGLSGLFNWLKRAVTTTVYIEYESASVNEAIAGTLTIPVKLSKVSSGTVTARITLTGAKSQREDWGFRANYSLSGASYDTSTLPFETSYIDVSFPPGTTTVELPLEILNNPTVDADKSLTLTITSASSVAIHNTNPVITINDAAREHDVDVTDQTALTAISGTLAGKALVADSPDDQSSNFQDILTYFANHPAVLRLPAGTYLCKSLDISPNTTLLGAGPSTIIKKVSGGELRQAKSESIFWAKAYAGATDTGVMAIKNLVLDGNDIPFLVTLKFGASEVDDGDYFYFNGDSTNQKFTFKTSASGADQIQIAAGDIPTTIANAKAKIAARGGYSVYDKTGDSTQFGVAYDTQPGYLWVTENCDTAEITFDNTELQSLVYGRVPTGAGYQVWRFENLTLRNSPSANGIFMPAGAKADLYRVNNNKTDIIARGGICLGGGTFRVKNCTTDFFHMELDTVGGGLANPYLISATVEDVDCSLANFAASGSIGEDATSTLSVTRANITRAWGITGNRLATSEDGIAFNSCTMTQGASPGYSGWTSNADGTGLRITRPGRIDFHNCTLTVTDASIGTYVRGAVPTVSGTADYTWPVAGGGRIVFDTCTFNGTRTGSDGLLTAYVNRINSTAQNENNNKLVFTNCTFGSGLDYAFMTGHAGTYTGTSGTGGMYVFTNPTVNAAKFLWLNGHNGGPTYSNFNIEITGGTYTNMGEWGYQYGYTAAANGSDNILKVSGVVISEAQNVIGNFTGIGATQFSRPDAAAGIMREIYGCTESPITSRIAGYVWAGATYDTLSSGWTVAKETWETAVSLTLSSEFDVAITAGKYFNGRYEVPTSALTGDKIRLTYPAHSTRTATVAGCSFGARSGSTMDFSTTPTRITFDGGNNGYTKTAGSADKVSDAITFAYNGATAYLHHLTHGTGGYYAQKYATLSGNDLYYLNNADNDEVLTADVTGYNAGSNEIGDFSKLEVRTSINSYKVSLADEPDSVTYNGVTLTKEPGVTLDVALNKWDWSSADGGTLWVNVGEDPTTHDLIAVYGTGTAARDVAYFDGIAYKCTAAGIAGVATWSLEEEYPPQVTGYFDDVWYDSGWYH